MKEVQSFAPPQRYRHLINRFATTYQRRREIESTKAILLRDVNERLKAINAEIQVLDYNEEKLMEEGRNLVPELRGFEKIQKTLIDLVVPFFANKH